MEILTSFATTGAPAFALTLARVSGVFLMSPVFSSRLIPVRAKLLVALGVTFAAVPFATGSTPAERAASVRALLDESVDAAFGTSADEQLLARIIRRGYLDADSSHEAVADEVFLSRATYFRRLRQATARVGAWVLEQRAD